MKEILAVTVKHMTH